MEKKIRRELFEQLQETKQKPPLLRALSDIKNGVFSVLFVLLKKNDMKTNRFLIFCVIFLEYIQIIQFVFQDAIVNLWYSSDIFKTFYKVVQYLNIKQYFTMLIGTTAFLVEFYLFAFLIFLVVADIIYVAISFKQKIFRAIWPLHILRHFVNLVITIFFLPVISTFSMMVS